MLDPPPMIEFLKLRACSVRIKGRHALNGARAACNSNTEQQYKNSGKTENKRWFRFVIEMLQTWVP